MTLWPDLGARPFGATRPTRYHRLVATASVSRPNMIGLAGAELDGI